MFFGVCANSTFLSFSSLGRLHFESLHDFNHTDELFPGRNKAVGVRKTLNKQALCPRHVSGLCQVGWCLVAKSGRAGNVLFVFFCFFFFPSFFFATKLIHICAGGMDTDLPDTQYWSLRLAAEAPGLHNSSVVRGPYSLQTQGSVCA